MVDMQYNTVKVPEDGSVSPTAQESIFQYQYVPLACNGSEIRLISLKQASTMAEQINCEILHTKVDDVDYLALSYTWGSLPDRQNISVGGKIISCTPNLYSALQHLRRRSEDLILWVDAICIDQNNLEERNQQVGIMRYIYKNASRVVVWLGPASEDRIHALELVSELDKHSHDGAYIEKKIANPESLEDFYALCRLFDLDYWKRVWVVQEVFSAKAIVVYCGSYTIPWQNLVSVQKMLSENYDAQLGVIFRDHPAMRGYITWHGPHALRLVYGDLPADSPDLFEIVLKHASKQASDPRDKIYAFVGILKQNETHLIDYSSPVRDVYMNFVYHTVLQSRSLDILCALRRDWNNSNQYEPPLWVPNWGMKGAYPEDFLQAHTKSLYRVCASGATYAQVQFDLVEGAIFVQGGSIDTVHHLGKPCLMERADDFEPALTAILDWWDLSKSLNGTSVQSQEAFVRTLCVDRIGTHHITSHYTKCKLLQWVLGACSTLALKFRSEIDLDETLRFSAKLHNWSLYTAQEARGMEWVSRISSNILHRRLCVSSSGILGLGPDAIQQGDKICILLGCSFPVILRPIDNHYIFIGSAYVDGYMTGEALEAVEKLEIQDFKIL
jgi:hypothetical protein